MAVRMLLLLVLAALWGLRAAAFELPAALAARAAAAPDRLLEDIAALVHGFGGERGLDRQGAAQALALARARIRQRETRRLLLADLDADGAVTAAELAVLMRAEGAAPRGRLALAHLRADADGDGTVSAAELDAAARRAAATETAGLAQELDGMLALDLDGDGFVTLPEARQALTLAAGGA